jgi:hypothetical protein
MAVSTQGTPLDPPFSSYRNLVRAATKIGCEWGGGLWMVGPGPSVRDLWAKGPTGQGYVRVTGEELAHTL